jgi:glycerate 2-kinase
MPAPDPRSQPRAFLEHLYRAAVLRAQPLHNTAAFLPPPPLGRTVVLGAGKAGGAMAQAVEALWPAQAPLSGLVVTRYCPSASKWSRPPTQCRTPRACWRPNASSRWPRG